jgi:hypothetical protein
MGFIMRNWLNQYKTYVLILFFSLSIECVWAEEFRAVVYNVSVTSENGWYKLNADINYYISPTAREALHKGISLSWIVKLKVQQHGVLWDATLEQLEMGYQIQRHTLLNLYSVKMLNNGATDMFTTLTAALSSISKIRDLSIIEKSLIVDAENYQIAIKVLFDREALPVPLRPMSYFNSEWALSSPWSIWQLQK